MNQIKVTPFQQLTDYSCVAGIFQTLCDYHGYEINHFDAIELLNIDEDGGYLKDVARACNKYLNTRHKTLKSIFQVEKYISLKSLIISADNLTYESSHCILIVGFDKNSFSILDPNTAKITFWNKHEFFEQTDEFIVIYK
jgi:ABC-type bacteriocin/lantibiotic exporter with double-glycine peptidase domain